MRKQTLYGKEARDKVLAGVNKISDAVCVTLGPLGRNVLLSQSMVVDYGVHSLPIEITKDGYRVTRGFDLDDPFEKPGVLMAKECAQKSVDQSGDGTTTSIVLMRAIVVEGMKLVEAGENPIELKKSIDNAVEYVVSELKRMAVPIRGDIAKIRQISTVSANNDSSIGDMIADAFAKIGDEGIIDIEKSSGVKTEIKISDGYKWSKGWGEISPLFINNKEKQICEFIDPLILLYDKRILHHTQIKKALELAMSAARPIVIICEDSAEEGLAFLAVNNIQQRIRCCVVKSPGFGDSRREEMEDIAMLTGGTYISDIRGVNIQEIEFENFGQAKKVVVTKDETVIIGGVHDGEELANMLNELRMNLAQAKNEDEKYPIEKRIARLNGGVAVIQVGANTETEMKERMDRFDDSIRATKSAIEEGFIIGAGTAFLRISMGNHIDINMDAVTGMPIEEVLKIYNQTGLQFYSKDKNSIGRELIFKVLREPLIQICKNAGVNPDDILEKVIKGEINDGYNAKTGKIEDLIESGIIDPVKVLRCALQNAASSATMILTSECIICDTL
jgi:chaperonin GroEL